jgi:hypothetical protein
VDLVQQRLSGRHACSLPQRRSNEDERGPEAPLVGEVD